MGYLQQLSCALHGLKQLGLCFIQNWGAPACPASVVGKEAIERRIMFLYVSSQMGSASSSGAGRQISALGKE